MPKFAEIRGRLAKLAGPGPYGGGGGGAGWYGGVFDVRLPGSRRDWYGEAGDLALNAVVAACLGWLQDNFSTARLQVCRYATDGTDTPLEGHPLLDLLGPYGTPNPDYNRRTFWAAMIRSWKVDGNAYAIVGRDPSGRPAALWWEPYDNVRPVREPGSDRVVDYYDVHRSEGTYRLRPGEIVHLRDGLDPYNPMLGCARLKAAVRDVVGINRAADYTANIMGNTGVSKVFIPQDAGMVDEVMAEGIKRHFREAGDTPGMISVLTHPGEFANVGTGPQEMALDAILDRPEATVCALLGVSAMSLGLKVGDTTRTFTNLKESDRLSWVNGQIPMQDAMAEGLTAQLLPLYGGAERLLLKWDRSQVEALQRDAIERTTEATALRPGEKLATLNEARAVAGLPPVDGGDKSPVEEAEEGRERAEAIAAAGGEDDGPGAFGGDEDEGEAENAA